MLVLSQRTTAFSSQPAPPPTPYCGISTNLGPKYTFAGACPSELPANFFSKTGDQQHDILEAVRYAGKSPPRKRRCSEPKIDCENNTDDPKAFVLARIQAVVGSHLLHPAALPGSPILLARVGFISATYGGNKDTLTGVANAAEDYYLIARRDPHDVSRGRVLVVKYTQDASTGAWTQGKSADDATFEKCEPTHTPTKVDVADFFSCDGAHKIFSEGPAPRSAREVWTRISAYLNRLSRGDDADFPGPGAVLPDAATQVSPIASARVARSPFALAVADYGGWMTCALGCCRTTRN